MVENAGSSAMNAGDAGATPESKAARLVAPKEQATPPRALQGVVGHAVRPPSPLVVPPAVEEEDEVEEIEREESRPQAIQILHKRGDEVVAVQEEGTTR